MSDPVSLNERRAAKEKDCKLWEPIDCARALLRDIESGAVKPDKMFISYLEKLPEGGFEHGYYACNLGHEETIALLHVSLADATERWRR